MVRREGLSFSLFVRGRDCLLRLALACETAPKKTQNKEQHQDTVVIKKEDCQKNQKY